MFRVFVPAVNTSHHHVLAAVPMAAGARSNAGMQYAICLQAIMGNHQRCLAVAGPTCCWQQLARPRLLLSSLLTLVPVSLLLNLLHLRYGLGVPVSSHMCFLCTCTHGCHSKVGFVCVQAYVSQLLFVC